MAGWAINDLITRVEQLVQADDNQLLNKLDVFRSFCISALERYSRDFPKYYRWLESGDGTARYDFPSQFDPQFSSVVSVEMPTQQVPPTFLRAKEYQVYENDYTTYQLLFLQGAPDSAVQFGVAFTVRRTWADIPDAHKEAFAALAASGVCDVIASRVAGRMDSTVSADTVDPSTASSAWTDKARAFWRLYAQTVLPRKQEDVKAAEAVSDVDSPFAETSSRIFHTR